MKKKYNQIDTKFFQDDTLELIYQIMKLKNLYRQGWLKRNVSIKHGESVADHSFGTAITAWILAETSELDLDINKVIKLALIHELGEIYAGDITPVDGVSLETKHQLELNGVTKILNNHPLKSYFLELWNEFENESTPEAIFVKQIDKFEMGLQAEIYKGHAKDSNIKEIDCEAKQMDEFIHSAEKVLSNHKLKQLFFHVKSRK